MASEEYSNRIIYELGAVSVAAGIILIRLAVQRTWGQYDGTRQDFSGRTVVITGASSGLGKQTALQMMKRGARVIIGCRNERSALQTIADIRAEIEDSEKIKSRPDQIVYHNLDLSSFDSVVQFANKIQQEPRLDVLINNAGVYCPPFELTRDGYELTMQSNHLGHSLLSSLLLPKLAATGTEDDPARLLMVSSTHYIKGEVRNEDYEHGRRINNENFDGRAEYNNSKLAMAAFSLYLYEKIQAKKLPVNTYTVSPGLVMTNLGRHIKQRMLRSIIFLPFAIMFLRTPFQGCQAILQCALSTRIRNSSGELYRNCRRVDGRGPLSISNQPDTVKRISSLTMNIINDRLTPQAKEILN